jgi:hypothetical protein
MLRAPSFRLFSGERVGALSPQYPTCKLPTTMGAPGLDFQTWDSTNAHLLLLSIHKCSVPHPFAFFLAKGWEPSVLNIPPVNSPRPWVPQVWIFRPGIARMHISYSYPSTNAPCPILSPFFWRKGGIARPSPLSVPQILPEGEHENSPGWSVAKPWVRVSIPVPVP